MDIIWVTVVFRCHRLFRCGELLRVLLFCFRWRSSLWEFFFDHIWYSAVLKISFYWRREPSNSPLTLSLTGQCSMSNFISIKKAMISQQIYMIGFVHSMLSVDHQIKVGAIYFLTKYMKKMFWILKCTQIKIEHVLFTISYYHLRVRQCKQHEINCLRNSKLTLRYQ